MALCWFSLVLEPSVAVKQSAIEFAHSGRTLNRKEGSSHSFWSYCLTTRLKQSNSSVAIAGCLQACHGFFFFFSFPPGGHWGRGAGMDRNWLFMVFPYFWWFDDIFSWLTFRYPFFWQQSLKRVRVDEYMFRKWSKDSILSLRMYSENREK